jgi:hypothetical protein
MLKLLSVSLSGTLETSLTVSLFGEGRALTDRWTDIVTETDYKIHRQRERQSDRQTDSG